jgi:hypothetical protein
VTTTTPTPPPTAQQVNRAIAAGVVPVAEALAADAKRKDYEPVVFEDLSPEHQKKWRETQQFMMYKFPGFLHLWSNLLNGQKINPPTEYMPAFSRQVPIAATDGHVIILNPDTFFEMGLLQRAFVCCHEIMHNARGDVDFRHKCIMADKVPMHDGTFLPYDEENMQHSMDYVINAGLVEGGMGKMPTDANGKAIGLLDPTIKRTDSFLDVYKAHHKDKPKDEAGGFDNLLGPGTSSGNAGRQRDQGQWNVAIEQAAHIEAAKSQGRGKGMMQRLFEKLLEPDVPWVDHIETLILRNVGDGSYDYTQPDPWLGNTPEGESYYSPKPSGMGAGWIVVTGDTSGSRTTDEITNNVANLAGIIEAVNPQRLTMLWWDDGDPEVQELDEASDLTKLKPIGGGGTDAHGVCKWLKDQHDVPDLIINFTDGYFTYPKEKAWPNCPIIWAISTKEKVPYGQRVQVCANARRGW